jgi:uncharacterized protein YcbK (DUF882 family)
MTRVSPHLTWSELACHDGTPYPKAWASLASELADTAFEPLREAAGGRPMIVLSAYRTVDHNRRIGGARFSQHLQGRALDVAPPDGVSVEQLRRMALKIPAIRGIGVYATFLHIDIRVGRRVSWFGRRRWADVSDVEE